MLERLLITAAAAWYLSYAVTSTDGAWGMFSYTRDHWPAFLLGRRGMKLSSYKITDDGIETNGLQEQKKNGVLDCIVCLIFWIALIIGYLQGLTIIESIAAAGVGLFLHGFTGYRYNVQ